MITVGIFDILYTSKIMGFYFFIFFNTNKQDGHYFIRTVLEDHLI